VVRLDRVVRVLLDVVPRCGQQLVEDRRVDHRGVDDHLGRLDLEHGDGPPEEPPSRGSVPAHRHVDDLPVLVDGSVNIPPDTVGLHVGLVHIPSVARRVAGTGTPQTQTSQATTDAALTSYRVGHAVLAD